MTTDASEATHAVLRKPGNWLEWAARWGYAARGVIYLLVGAAAALAAIGAADEPTGIGGSLRRTLRHPAGQVIVLIVVLGLAAHATWALVQAAVDPEERARARRQPQTDHPPGRAGYRVARGIEGLVHVAMLVGGLALITGWEGDPTSADAVHRSRADRWAAWAMAFTGGRLAVGLTGVGVVAFGVWEIVRAARVGLDAMLSLRTIDAEPRRLVVNVSRFGIAARGAVFALAGGWLAWAAWQANARDAKDLGDTLRDLHHRPLGSWLLAAAAAGLLAYAVYEFLRAGYRRIGPRQDASRATKL